MGEPVNQAQFYAEMQAMRTFIEEKHTSMRQYVGERADKLEQQFRDHEHQDHEVEKRVTIIETERKTEEGAAAKRGTWAGILAAAAFNAAISAAKVLWGK